MRNGTHEERWGDFKIRVARRDDGRFDGIIFRKGSKAVKVRGDPNESEAEVRERLKREVMRRHPDWVGYAGAIRFFRSLFPRGFDDEGYLDAERRYKWNAKQRLDETAPLESALDGDGFGRAVLRAYQQTNLLSRFELMRVKDVVNSDSGDSFVRGAAAFASGDMETGLREMVRALKPHEAAKWTIVTYLPFLWNPDAHMFLKPEVTKLFADRVGHELALLYRADMDLDVYKCLLDLAASTANEIDALGPSDRIDVQSFIWVVGKYAPPETSTA